MSRILCVTTNKGRGGIAFASVLYTKTFLRLGYTVDFLCYEQELVRELHEPLVSDQLRLHTLPRGWRWKIFLNPFLAFYLWRLARNADLVLFHNATVVGLFRFLAPTVMRVAVNHMRKWRNFHKAHLVLCPNAGVQKNVLNPKLEKARTRVVPLGLSKLPPRPKTPPPRDVLKIGGLGRFVIYKGFDVLLEAVARLDKKQFCLVLMGEGPEKAALKAQARALNLAVEFLPWDNCTDSFYKSLDIFCSASRVEPFGLVIIEAMAYGLPVVATQTDGAQGILRNNSVGILVPQHNPDALAKAFTTLQDRELRLRLRKAARREVKKRFSPKTFQRCLVETLRLDVPVFGTYAPGFFERFILFCARFPGRGFWRKLYRQSAHRSAHRKKIMDVIRNGFRLRLSVTDNGTDRTMLFSPHCFGSREVGIVLGWLKPGGIFVDVGANTGFFALIAARAVGDTGRVVAIEPNPRLVKRLRYHLDINGFFGARVLPVAVGAQSKKVPFQFSKKHMDTGAVGEVAAAWEETQTVDVPMSPLHQILEEYTKIDVLKVDVEGYEDRVLVPFFEAAPKKLWPRFVMLEHCNRRLWKKDCVKHLQAVGYKKISVPTKWDSFWRLK